VLLKFRQKLFLCCSCIMAYFCGLVLYTTLHIYLHRPEEIGKHFAPRHNYNILQKMFSVLSVLQLNGGSWIVFVTKRIWFLWAFTSEEMQYYSEQKHDTFYYFHVLSLIRLQTRSLYDTFDQFLSSILKYYRYKIHHYVAAPLLNFCAPLLRPNPKSLTGG
jgi:hypothetical protein